MSIGQKIVSSAAWSFVGKLLAQIINFIMFVVLARVLVPDDFGLFGMVLVVLGFVTMLSEAGFNSALIQKEEVKDSDWSTLFWFNMILSVVFALAMIGISPLAAWFYDDPRVQPLIAAIGLQFPISALCGTHLTMLKRDMQFAFLAKMEVAGELIAGLLTVGLAIAGFGAWALIIKALTIYLIWLVATWGKGFWYPKWTFDIQMLRENFKYSFGFFNWNFTYYWSRNADNLLVGKFLGSVPLGLYTRAYTTMLMPLRQTNAVASRVMFSGLSRIQNDPEQVKKTYLRAVSTIALFGFPSMLGLAVVSRDFVLALYGPKWIGCVEVLQLLCLVGAVETTTNSTNWLFLSQGRSDLLARWGIFATILLLTAFGLGVYWGSIDFVGINYVILSCLIFPAPLFTLAGRLVGMRLGEVVRCVGPQALCAGVMAFAVTGLRELLPQAWHPAARLALMVALGALIYPLCLHIGRVRAYRDAVDYVMPRIRARLNR